MERVRTKKPKMMELFGNPKYKGKHVILAAGKIFTARTRERAAEILEEIRKKYRKVVPEVVYMPKFRFLTLVV